MAETLSARVDPADLIFFREMSKERFFAEALRLGVSDEQLRDPVAYDRVFRACLIAFRTDVVRGLAARLGTPLTDDQAAAIARNSLVPRVLEGPEPLEPDERKIARELYFHALQAAAKREGGVMSDAAARATAEKMVEDAERGPTFWKRHAPVIGLGGVLALVAVAIALLAGLVGAVLALAT